MSIVQAWLVLALCAPFLLAVWIAFVHRRRVTDGVDAAPGFDFANVRFEAETINLAFAVREAVAEIDPVARARWVRIDLAVKAALTVHVDPGVLGMTLREIMLTAIGAAPGGQVLVTAVTLGSQLHIRITDDGVNTDQRDREILTRGAEELIALQGGSIAVEARPGRGTTVTVRLPLPGTVAGDASVPKRRPVRVRQTA